MFNDTYEMTALNYIYRRKTYNSYCVSLVEKNIHSNKFERYHKFEYCQGVWGQRGYFRYL